MIKAGRVAGGNELLSAPALMKKINVSYGQKVADLGCGGSGIFVLQAAHLVGDKGVVYAVDVLKTALRSIEVKAKIEGMVNVKPVWSNLELFGATKIKTEALDHGLLINTLFQNDQHEAIIRESLRLIKRGGKLLIVDWKPSEAPFGPKESDRIRPEKIKDIIARIGQAKLIESFDAGPYHYGLIFEKK